MKAEEMATKWEAKDMVYEQSWCTHCP